MNVLEKRPLFTYRSYRNFLRALTAKYAIVTFEEARENIGQTTGLAILRHDIDMSLKAAAVMAEIEWKMGVSATYFFSLTNPLYNLFSREGQEHVYYILAAGHHFGLHFDCVAYHDNSHDEVPRQVARECRVLYEFFGIRVEAVSSHRPGPMALNGVSLGVPHSYDPLFQKHFAYFADSRGFWSKGHPLQSAVFEKGENLHLCLHPIWWTTEATRSFTCLSNLAIQLATDDNTYLSQNCQVWDMGIKESA